jgi:hypothetical protein
MWLGKWFDTDVTVWCVGLESLRDIELATFFYYYAVLNIVVNLYGSRMIGTDVGKLFYS